AVSITPHAVCKRPRLAPSSSASSSNIRLSLPLWWRLGSISPPPLGERRVGARDEHAVAEAIEAVVLSDRLAIGGEDPVPSGEGAHQHQQRALRQMKVGEHGVDNPELIARRDEEPGPALPRRNTVTGCSTFQDSDARGPHRDDPLALTAGLVDGARASVINPIPLPVDRVLCRIV